MNDCVNQMLVQFQNDDCLMKCINNWKKKKKGSYHFERGRGFLFWEGLCFEAEHRFINLDCWQSETDGEKTKKEGGYLLKLCIYFCSPGKGGDQEGGGKAEKSLTDFAAEYAKSNRSTCKGCEQKIEKVKSLSLVLHLIHLFSHQSQFKQKLP